MEDQNVTPAPATEPQPPPTTPAGTRRRNDVNQADLADIKAARAIALTAQNADYVATLAEQDIAPDLAPALVADCDTASNEKAIAVTTKTNAKEAITARETAAKQKLMTALRGMQDAVKRKFESTDPTKLAAYNIRKKNFGDDRKGLETDAQTMLKQDADDALPGFSQAKLAEVSGLLKAWMQADDDQSAAEKALETARLGFKKLVASINDRARQIQLAANTAWPYTEKANVVIRRAFALPTNRPLK
jgi:hypothetical protein